MSAATAMPAAASSIYTRGGPTTHQYVYINPTNTGEMSVVVVREVGANYNFTEAGPGTTIESVDDRCTLVSPTEATCPIIDNLGDLWAVDAELHDGPDSIDMRTTRGARIDGGAGSDVLKGGSAGDIITGDGDGGAFGPDGNDFIDGRGGADNMLGGDGADTVSYASRSTAVNVSIDGAANDGGFGEGDNVQSDVEDISGSQGGDTLTGNGSANLIRGNGGFDAISGLGGPDTLEGGDTADDLDGGAGDDSLAGEGGGDTLRGGADTDSLDGGIDDDSLFGGPGADDMFGGLGAADQVDYAGATDPLTVTVDDNPNDGAAGEADNVHSDVERVFGGPNDDTLVTFGDGGEVWGREGDDVLLGHNSGDRFESGDGDDALDGRFGADVMNGGGGVDAVDYTDHFFVDDESGQAFGVASTPDGVDNDGNGWIDFGGPGHYDNVGADIENLIGSGGPDSLRGSAEASVIAGGPDDDTLFGEDGTDTLFGEAGDDVLVGGLGPDVLDGGLDTDTVSYGTRTAAVRVTINDVANDGDVAVNEGDNVMRSVENVRGGAGADVLAGSAQENRLIGGDGNDSLNGGAGGDVLDGQLGIDTITYSTRPDRVAVTLDGQRNDGADPNANGISTAAEEGDLDLNIENATGGKVGDILTAPVVDATRNILRGLTGNDTLDSREGTATVDTLDCGNGAADRFAADPSDKRKNCEIVLP